MTFSQLVLNPLWPGTPDTPESLPPFLETITPKQGFSRSLDVTQNWASSTYAASGTNALFANIQLVPSSPLKVGLYYLAHPCGNPPNPRNFSEAACVAGELTTRGVLVYSSVTHTMPIWDAIEGTEHLMVSLGNSEFQTSQLANRPPPVPNEHWFKVDFKIFKGCVGLLLAPHWQTSMGCWREVGWAEGAEKPIWEVVWGETEEVVPDE